MQRTDTPPKDSVDHLLGAMPKAELHLHLDGSVRLETIAELAARGNLPLPIPLDRLAEFCVAPDRCRDLIEMLSYFALPIQVMQTPDSLERVTYELCEDLRRENVRYAEIRFGPSLHRQKGMQLDEVIAAVGRGWHAGRREFGLTGGIILCGLRHLPPQETLEVARAGLSFLGNGIVGFDLAGDEAHFPIRPFRGALLWAKDAGYGMTVHAGEAAGAESVRDAVQLIGVSRIGHGVRAGEDASLPGLLRDRGITLEMCPTSNLQTGAVTSLATYPLVRYYRDGVRVTINTDNRTVSATTEARELRHGHTSMGLTLPDLAKITLTAVEAGFSDALERRTLLEELRAEMNSMGIAPRPSFEPQQGTESNEN